VKNMNRRKPVLILFFLLLVNLSYLQFTVSNVQAQEPHYWTDIEVDKVYYIRGDSVNITALSYSSQVNVLIYYPDMSLGYNKTWDANTSRSIPVGDLSPYGTYTVQATSGEAVATTWFTVLDISGWNPVSLPYSRIHKNVNVTLFGNATVLAEEVSSGESLLIDLSWLKQLSKKIGTSVSVKANSMNIRARFNNPDDGSYVDVNFAFIHTGIKFIIKGSVSQPFDFPFILEKQQAKEVKSSLTGVRSGSLVFDWTDLYDTLASFDRFSNSTHVGIIVHVPASFSIDPAIFSDDFESNDYSQWTGTAEYGGTIATTSAWASKGTYSSLSDMAATSSAYAYCTKDLSAVSTIYVQETVKVTENLPSSGNKFVVMNIKGNNGSNTVLAVDYYNNGGTLEFRLNYMDGASLSTTYGTTNPSLNTVYVLEVYVKVHASAGKYSLFVNGTEEISVTGVDSDEYGNVDQIRVGEIWSSGATAHSTYVDNVITSATYIGLISPSNDGCSFINLETTDNIYAQSGTTYILTVNISDGDGFADITTVDASFLSASDYGLDFDGVDEYMNITGVTSTSQTYTFEAWIYLRSTANQYFVDIASGRLISLALRTENLAFHDGSWKSFGSLSINTWHYIAIVFDNDTSLATGYIDGVQSGSTQAYVGKDLGGSAAIGSHNAGSSVFMNAIIEDVVIYNRALGSSEILTNYNDGIDGQPSSQTGIIGWWKFDTGSGATAVDSSGNGYSGTLVNMEAEDWVLTPRIVFRYNQDTDTFSEYDATTGKWVLNTTASVDYSSGNDLDLEFHFSAEWNATEESDLDVKVITADAYENSDTDTYDLNADVVVTLLGTPEGDDSNNPDRVDNNSTVTMTGTVYYADDPSSSTASAITPPDAEFTSISIYDSSNNNEGTDTSIVSGAFSIAFTAPSSQGSDTYNLYINMADASYTDGELSTTETIITDQIQLQTLDANEVQVPAGTEVTIFATALLEYDSHSVGSGDTLVINGYTFTWSSDNSRFEYLLAEEEPVTRTFDTVTNSSCIEQTYRITVGDANSLSVSIEWYADEEGGGGGSGGGTIPDPEPDPTTPIIPPIIPPESEIDLRAAGVLVIIGVVGFAVYNQQRNNRPSIRKTSKTWKSNNRKNTKKKSKWKKNKAWD